MQAVALPVAYARADFGAAAMVDPSATDEKNRDKLTQRESAERRNTPTQGAGRLVDIYV